MNRLTGRRTLLLAAVSAAAAVFAGAATPQSTETRVTIEYEGRALIPKGDIEIQLEPSDALVNAAGRAATTHVPSDGKSKKVDLALNLPKGISGAPAVEVVARLEREDGWLLARGSALLEAGLPVHITLYTVMY